MGEPRIDNADRPWGLSAAGSFRTKGSVAVRKHQIRDARL
jgi:hypothetical protein